MFTLMTYNILKGGADRLGEICTILAEQAPDFVALNEANDFDRAQEKMLKDVAEKIGLPYYALAVSESGYHVAVASRFPFKALHTLAPLRRAGIACVVEAPIGEVCIVATHMTPYSEADRAPEALVLEQAGEGYENCLLVGDLNSLSPADAYPESMIADFNEKQIKKFTTNGALCFDTITHFLNAGFVDMAVAAGQNKIATTPTASNVDVSHISAGMRLDYVLARGPVAQRLVSYTVIKNSATDRASDHYPVLVAFS